MIKLWPGQFLEGKKKLIYQFDGGNRPTGEEAGEEGGRRLPLEGVGGGRREDDVGRGS